MGEEEIIERINRHLRVKYAAARLNGPLGNHGTFAVYTKTLPPREGLRPVGQSFFVSSDGRFNAGDLPREARMTARRSRKKQQEMNAQNIMGQPT